MEDIDKVFYINLENRTDRKELIEKEFEEYGITNYERFNAHTHTNGLVGCGMSHQSVLKIAKERKYKRVLIFEDDFTFLVPKNEFEENMNKLKNVNFDVCFLSYNLQKFSEVDEHDFLLKAINSLTASGYIINEHYYDKLINELEVSIPLLEQTDYRWLYANDVIWHKFQLVDNYYCFKTRIGKQRASYSDNNGRYEDYNV
jgi:GR25 family glycosyltransferase involved in LPS biosynthesis